MIGDSQGTGGAGRSGAGRAGGSAEEGAIEAIDDDDISLLDAGALEDESIGIDMSDIGIELAEELIGGSDIVDASGIDSDADGTSEDGQLGSAQSCAMAGEARVTSPSRTRDRRRMTIPVAWR